MIESFKRSDPFNLPGIWELRTYIEAHFDRVLVSNMAWEEWWGGVDNIYRCREDVRRGAAPPHDDKKNPWRATHISLRVGGKSEVAVHNALAECLVAFCNDRLTGAEVWDKKVLFWRRYPELHEEDGKWIGSCRLSVVVERPDGTYIYDGEPRCKNETRCWEVFSQEGMQV